MGAAAERQSHLSRRDTARFHAERRGAGDADRAAAARCPPGRLLSKTREQRVIGGEPRAEGGELPPVSLVRRYDTHRLIPSKYSNDGASVLARIAEGDAHLAEIFDLDHATNDRLLAENDRLPGIGVHELIFGVPCYRIVNAAFTHAHPLGGRFNSPERGAWYTAFELKTAQAEVAFHKTVHLAEIGRFEDEVTFDDYLSDFSAQLHDLRRQGAFRDCLDPDSYVRSQALAERLQAAGSLGVVYPSVRRPEGTCLACFRPALVGNVRKGSTYRFRWSGDPTPTIAIESGHDK